MEDYQLNRRGPQAGGMFGQQSQLGGVGGGGLGMGGLGTGSGFAQQQQQSQQTGLGGNHIFYKRIMSMLA